MIFVPHHSPVVIDELQEILGEPYSIAIKVILKYEIDLHTIAWYGLTELRDVTTHIASAMNADDEKGALIEIGYAREHIRRAALETLHEYASDMYFELEPRLKGSKIKYKLLMLPSPDPNRVQELNEKIQKCLLEARMSRGTDWIKSVDNFYDAVTSLKELSNEVPPISEIRWRIFTIFIGILTLISSISAFDWIWNIVKGYF